MYIYIEYRNTWPSSTGNERLKRGCRVSLRWRYVYSYICIFMFIYGVNP